MTYSIGGTPCLACMRESPARLYFLIPAGILWTLRLPSPIVASLLLVIDIENSTNRWSGRKTRRNTPLNVLRSTRTIHLGNITSRAETVKTMSQEASTSAVDDGRKSPSRLKKTIDQVSDIFYHP